MTYLKKSSHNLRLHIYIQKIQLLVVTIIKSEIRKISQDSMFFDKNPKVHATSSPGSFLRSPTSLPRLFFLFYFISPETVKLWHASFLQRRPLSTQIRASIVGNKSQKNPKPKYLKKKSQKNPNCFKNPKILG